MQARLSHVERLNQHQAAKLAKLSQEVDALRAENSILRQSVLEADPEVSDAEDGDGDEDLQTLRRERDQYREQVLAMTKFLHDYGLTWVGDKEQEEETAQLNESLAEKLSRPTSAQVDVQVMCARVEELNALVRQEGAKVVSNRVGGAIHARLATDQAPLPLSFFQDGVKLGRCNFQPFGSRAAQQLLQATPFSAKGLV
ncbi:UBXN11 [Symbiodinium microadriaticum]|nr:UBXN11 [Symbiodinium microadriaticum]